MRVDNAYTYKFKNKWLACLYLRVGHELVDDCIGDGHAVESTGSAPKLIQNHKGTPRGLTMAMTMTMTMTVWACMWCM